MNLTAKQLKKVAHRLGYQVKEGKKHSLIYGQSRLVATLPRGRIKPGTLAAILKQMGISKDDLADLL
ncbi:MAG TPA: type II toxin-antitoxin system HicA family toxin [Desulfomonilaceae bacterium]|nr:type II toxin-antitoxin system HicA family toxin [Desulfomonilaceae bacterium]